MKDQTHVGLGSGYMPLPEIISALKQIKYNAGIILEIHHDKNYEQALRKSKQILDLLWKQF